MMKRCYDPKNKQYHDYGGRGIVVCDRWRAKKSGFVNFVSDVGSRPDGLQLDRCDNDGPYAPDNVRWVTPKENNRHKRSTVYVTVGGVTKPLMEWVETAVVDYYTAYSRLRKGWSPEQALYTQKGIRRRSLE